MKKNVIFISLLAFSSLLNAQEFNPPGATPGTPAYRKAPTGFGMTIAPGTNMVEIETTSPNDGLSITQRNSGASLIKLNNTTGTNWSLNSLDNSSAPGGGFSINNLSSGTTPLVIDPNTGNIGVGTTAPTFAKLQVEENAGDVGGSFLVTPPSSGGSGKIGAKGRVYSAVTNTVFGVVGDGDLTAAGGGFATGVFGSGEGGNFNMGGQFTAFGSASYANYGIYAAAYGAASNYAGYFNGDVYTSGVYTSSDRKLKQNIKPLTNALDKLLLLKPSTYAFRTTEFKDMNLPSGNQMGLIAQELEEVFPELIKNMSAIEIPGKNGEKTSIPEFKSVQYISLIPVLIAAIQEQQAQIAELKNTQKITDIASANSTDALFSMSQNEPNPFDGITVINYNLPETINTAYLAVYDLSGKQIASFPIHEKGKSSLKITSEKLAAGIYIYSIVADGKVVDSKKMIVAEKQ